MLTVRTYYVGLGRDTVAGYSAGLVKRMDNLNGVWNNVSLPLSLPNANVALYDVETDPNNGNKVFVVGDASYTNGCFGIYFSTNGGVTWQVPGGNYQSIIGANANHWNEVTVVDSNTIYVCGTNGYVCKSTNGGLTFNLCTQIGPLPASYLAQPSQLDCYSIHFITPLAGVVGLENNTVMTSDGGVTWSPCCGGNGIESNLPGVTNPGRIYGIHLDVTSQIVVALGQNTIVRSTNASTNYSPTYTWNSGNGIHLTWEDDLRLWAFGGGAERMRSIDGGVTWTILNAYSSSGAANRAGHFYLNDNGFISANTIIAATSDGGLTGTISDNPGNIITAIWTNHQDRSCYLLTDCEGVIPPFIVDNDLSAVVGGTVQLCPGTYTGSSTNPDPLPGRVPNPQQQGQEPLPLDSTECKCFTVSEIESCNGAITVVVTASFPDCQSCQYCYILVDCTNPNHIIVTGDNLAQYVGMVIKLEDCPDICWTVRRSHECPDPVCVAPVIASYENCEDCLPAPPELPVPELHIRRVKPGYTTPGCSPEYTEKVSCTFANTAYDQMIVTRYGITVCCSEDMMKWDIKKQLLDLRAIYDPSACRSTLNLCCPPCNVTAVMNAFNPRPCPEPENVEAQLRIADVCPAPGDIEQVSIILGQ